MLRSCKHDDELVKYESGHLLMLLLLLLFTLLTSLYCLHAHLPTHIIMMMNILTDDDHDHHDRVVNEDIDYFSIYAHTFCVVLNKKKIY